MESLKNRSHNKWIDLDMRYIPTDIFTRNYEFQSCKDFELSPSDIAEGAIPTWKRCDLSISEILSHIEKGDMLFRFRIFEENHDNILNWWWRETDGSSCDTKWFKIDGYDPAYNQYFYGKRSFNSWEFAEMKHTNCPDRILKI